MSAVSFSVIYKYFSYMLVSDAYLFQVSTAWGIGLIIGPALGGFLAQVTLIIYKFYLMLNIY